VKNFRVEFNCYNPHLPCGNSFEIMATYFLEKIYFQARNRRAAEAIVEALLLYNEKIVNALGLNPIISNNGVIEDVYLYEEDGTKHFFCEIEGDMNKLNFTWNENTMDINKKVKSEDRMSEINEIKKQENKNLAQMCLGNLEQIEKSVMEIEKMIKEFQKIQLTQTKSYIETQKELLKYFVR